MSDTARFLGRPKSHGKCVKKEMFIGKLWENIGEKQSQRRISWENHEFYPLDLNGKKPVLKILGFTLGYSVTWMLKTNWFKPELGKLPTFMVGKLHVYVSVP
jgi:hypothetical protein